MSDVTLALSIPSHIFTQFKKFCSDYGLTPSAAVNVFISACLRNKDLPFHVTGLAADKTEGVVDVHTDHLYARVNPHNNIAFKEFCRYNGISPSSAVSLFILACLHNYELPFHISGLKADGDA